MKGLVGIGIVTLAVSVASAQKFVDNSPADSPLTLTASLGATTGMCAVAIHDNDLRPVVAVVVWFDGIGKNGAVNQHIVHDHFFRSDEHIAMNGKDIDMPFPCDGFEQAKSMHLQFVQFNDGQTWSGNDAETSKEIARQRRAAIAYVKGVLASPDVKAALAKPPHSYLDADGVRLVSGVNMWYRLKKAIDPVATAKEILANADEHKAWLDNLK